MKKASYYQILEIDRNATKPEIKAAFRRKAKLLHPDTNPSQDAQEEFVLLTEAYNALYNHRYPKRALILRPPKPKYTPEEIKRNERDRYEHPKTDEDRRRHLEKARRRLLRRQKMAERSFMIHYHRLLGSKVYRFTQVISILSVILGLMVAIEVAMPFDLYKTSIEKVTLHAGPAAAAEGESSANRVQYRLNFKEHPGIQVSRELYHAVRNGQTAQLKTTPLFFDVAEVAVQTPSGLQVYQPRNSLAKNWFLMIIGLVLPVLTFALKSPNVFYFKVLALTRVMAIIFISWLLFGNDRLFSFFQYLF